MALTLPNVPTDNMYKFMTILGLVLMVASMYLGYESGKTATEEAILAKGKAEALERVGKAIDVDQASLKAEITDIVKRIGALNDRLKMLRNSPEQMHTFLPEAEAEQVDLEARLKDFTQRAEENRRQVDEGLQASADLSTQIELAQLHRDYFRRDFILFLVLGGLGGGIMGLGFMLWYQKLQKYLDIQVVNAAKALPGPAESESKSEGS